jgi:RNA polymerase sigma factor (sigma-70 family)
MPPGDAAPVTAEARFLADLSRRYRPILARFFQKRIQPQCDVDDLIQEVFARLTRRGDLGGVTHIEGYIFQVAANLIRERARERAVREVSLDRFGSEAIAEDFSSERILLGKEAITQVYAALHELPQRTRNAFLLHRFEDLKHAEIAQRLGISVSTVEKDIMRAMTHLMKRVR